MALLICIECGETSENGEGWKGKLAVGLLDEEEPDEVAVYCPKCWSREKLSAPTPARCYWFLAALTTSRMTSMTSSGSASSTAWPVWTTVCLA